MSKFGSASDNHAVRKVRWHDFKAATMSEWLAESPLKEAVNHGSDGSDGVSVEIIEDSSSSESDASLGTTGLPCERPEGFHQRVDAANALALSGTADTL